MTRIAPKMSKLYPLDGPLPDTETFASLLAIWQRKRNGKAPPSRYDFGFKEFRGWHSRYALIEFQGTLGDGTMRIIGEEYHNAFSGILWPGMNIREVRHQKPDRLLAYYNRVRSNPAIGHFVGSLPNPDRGHVHLEIIDIPLRGKFDQVDYCMSFMAYLKKQL